jgi:predicted Zn-dependent protease
MMNRGRYAEAETMARNLLGRHPDLGFLWKVYGVALMRQAKDALPVLQRATQLLPNDAETYYYVARAQPKGRQSSLSRLLVVR